MAKEKKISATNLVNNKRARSIVFLFISFIIILAINAMLPVVEGQAHFTVDAVEMSYLEYTQLQANNDNYDMTWASEQKIKKYIEDYIEAHPELTEEEKVTIVPPDALKVNVFTKFFFEYPFWYIGTATALASAVLLFYSLFNYLLVVSKDKYGKYIKIEGEIETLVDSTLDPDTFEPWMDNVFNRDRKIKQHESNVKYLIDKLETKTKYENKRRLKKYFLATTDIDRGLELKKLDKLSKKEQKYFNKKEMYLALLEKDHIETYVINGRVKYFKYIHPMFVYNGTNNIGRTVDGYSMISSDSSRIASDAGAKVILSLSITLIFSTLLTVTAVSSVDQDPFWMWVNIVAKIAPLLLQVPLAFDYNNTFMKKQLLPNLMNRRSIGMKYGADMLKGVRVEPLVTVPEPTPENSQIITVPNEEVIPDAKENHSGDRHVNT